MNKGESFIRSVFLGKIKEAFDRNAELQSLLLDNFFSKAVQDCQVQEVSQEWPQIAAVSSNCATKYKEKSAALMTYCLCTYGASKK